VPSAFIGKLRERVIGFIKKYIAHFKSIMAKIRFEGGVDNDKKDFTLNSYK